MDIYDEIIEEAAKLKPEADEALRTWEESLAEEIRGIEKERLSAQAEFRKDIEALKIKRVSDKLAKHS